MLRLRTILISLFLCACSAQAQDIDTLLHEFFTSYHLSGYQPSAFYRMDSATIDDAKKEISIYANEAFCAQPFTPSSVRNIYSRLQRKLYQPYNTYSIFIFNAKGENIEQLIPNLYREGQIDDARSWLNQLQGLSLDKKRVGPIYGFGRTTRAPFNGMAEPRTLL